MVHYFSLKRISLGRPENFESLVLGDELGPLREPVRRAVFGALGEIDFGGTEIRIPASRFETVRAAIARQFADYEITSIGNTDMFKVAKRAQEPCPATTPVQVADTPDDPVDYARHHIDGEWTALIQRARDARNLADEINTPKKRARRVKWFLRVRNYGFDYRNQRLTLTGDNDKLRTKKGILAWMREVNLKFRSGVL